MLGIRVDNFYYAHWNGKRFVFDMSRYLPWGKHVVDNATLWKEYTYPSEPGEIDFSTWLKGFIKKECGGTIEELQALKKKNEDCAVKHLTGFCSYNETGCSDCKGKMMIKTALEKAEPKKLRGNDGCNCPKCMTFNEVFEKRRNTIKEDTVYCWHCGQAIKPD